MNVYDADYLFCSNCDSTIEDLHNKIYQLELYVEEITESNREEVDCLHSEIDKLEKELRESANHHKGVF